jgi:hypothetical protein
VKATDASETLNEISERGGNSAKFIALGIAVLAALLAFVEVSGGNAEQDAQKSNLDAANLWAFYQRRPSARPPSARLPSRSRSNCRACRQSGPRLCKSSSRHGARPQTATSRTRPQRRRRAP